MSKPLLLIVDDNPSNLITLQAALDTGEYVIVEAHSGQEALDRCQEYEFALIILDVFMPEMDGYTTARLIKENSRKNADTPIMFVTAIYKDDSSIRKGFEVGAVDYFGKPFDPDILKKKVNIYADLFQKTKRLRVTEELLATQAQLKTLLDAIPVGVIVCDAAGRIYENNEEADRIWGGLRKVNINNYDEYKAWWPETGKKVQSQEWAMAKALATGKAVKEEVVDIESFDGERRTILNSAYPIKGTDGKVLGAVTVIQDITSKKVLLSDIERIAEHLPSEHHSRH